MELRQLSYFEAVCRHRSFSRAAEELRIAQPAVSAQIRHLEREIGVSLLARTTRRVEMTDAGRRFLPHALAALENIDAAAHAARDGTRLRGRLRVGATPISGSVDLGAALRRFRVRYPAVDLSLLTGLADPLRAAPRHRDLDVVVAPRHTDERDLFAHVLAEESLVVVTSVEDARPISGLADVADDEFVCLGRHSGLRTLLDTAFARIGRVASVPFEADSPARIRDLVAAGLGTSLLAESAARGPGRPVRVVPLPDLPAHPPICVFTRRRGRSVAARRFVDIVRDS